MAPIARLSGLQKDVLALYRSILRESIRKDRKVASHLLSSSSSSSATSQSQQQTTPTDATDEAAAAASSPHHHHQHHSPFGRSMHSSSADSSESVATTSTTTLDYARKKFRQEAAQVRRSDFKTIEYKIRKGRKQLELLKMPGVNVVGGAS